MASPRYTRFINQNEPPEEKREYTKKEKAQNFWLYHKWYFIGGAAALALVISFIFSIVTKVTPDYTIGLITQTALPQTLITSLEESFSKLVTDTNGDGKALVLVNQFNLSFDAQAAPQDPNVQMAHMTRLMGDLQTMESVIFLTDDLQNVQDSQGFFAYNDTSIPDEGEKIDYSKMGYKWSESPFLMALELGEIQLVGFDENVKMPDGQLYMKDYYIVLRTFDTSTAKENKSTEYHTRCLELFNKLTAK